MTEKTRSQEAWSDSLINLSLATDFVDNAEHSKWKLALYLSMIKAIVYALWAIYFEMVDDETE